MTVTVDIPANAPFTVNPGSLTFTTQNWDRTQPVTVTAIDDSDAADEPTATISHTISSNDAIYRDDVTPGTVSVTVKDDDLAVNFGAATYTVDEGSTVDVKVKLSADPERSVTIPITKAHQGGAGSGDYSGVPADETFASRETEKAITFAATDDPDNDDGEKMKLTLGSLPTGVTAGTVDETTVSITDDDLRVVTVTFENATYTVAEGSSVTVKVKLDREPDRTVVNPLASVPQGGATSADYSGVPANVAFASGETEKTITFSAAADDVDDDDESVKLGFPTRVTAGTIDESTVNITDDDVPQVTASFEQATYTVAEGSSVTVKVKLSADPERSVTIPITKNNEDGTTSADYSGVPANVAFASGETAKTITFSAAADDVDDDDESVKLGFGTLPTRVTAGAIDESTVNIMDDDVPQVTASFEQATYTVAEGSSVTVKVKLSADPERTVTIPITKANQGGASSGDYSGVPANLAFASGDTEKTITFAATTDTDNDDGEKVKLGFGTLPTGVSEGTTGESVVSITDDDVPSVTVSFEQSTYTVNENSTVDVTVELDVDPERSVTIPITPSNQGGASSSDYSVPTSVTVNSGVTEKTFTFSATQDTVDDDEESVKLGFGSMPTGAFAINQTQATVNITDDDVPAVTVSFAAATYTAPEGGSVQVKVTLSEAPERQVTVPITKTNQGGTSNSD